MKRISFLSVCAALILFLQSLLNCSSPLESTGGSVPSPPGAIETLLVHDTVFLTDSISDTLYDTVFVIDSVGDTIYDTIIVIDSVGDTIFDTLFDTVIVTDTITNQIVDTITIVDTVIIIQPDTSCPVSLCSEISSSSKIIIWLLDNADGFYRLEFNGSRRSNFNKRDLFVVIDGQQYDWNFVNDDQFIIELQLSANSRVEIFPDIPPAFGHVIDVCLKVTKL